MKITLGAQCENVDSVSAAIGGGGGGVRGSSYKGCPFSRWRFPRVAMIGILMLLATSNLLFVIDGDSTENVQQDCLSLV